MNSTMTELESLIGGYWNNTLSPAEKERLLDLVGKDHPIGQDAEGYALYRALLEEGSAGENRKDVYFQEQWAGVKAQLGMEQHRKPVYRWWLAAASVVLAIGCCYWWLNRSVDRDPVIAPKPPALATILSNNSGVVLDTVLPDGSNVHLYPGSEVRFTAAYNTRDRELDMNGRALFDVRQEPEKPFLVHAGTFTTTVLGTKFEVNTEIAGKFLVRLLSGKVVVRSTSMKAVYLKPGQSLVYDLRSKRPVVDGDKQKELSPAPELNYSNLPLGILFKQLEQEEGIQIICADSLSMDKFFTGTFLKSDSPDKIMKQIARQYHFHIRKEDNVFTLE